MDFNSLLQQGTAQAWLYLPIAVVLGALHGLEPGHSKTMMAAFIIAVRGTVLQAALLGLSAAISHSLIIWALAALALKFGSQWNVETAEPYFLIATGVIVVAMAVWTIWRLQNEHEHLHDEDKSLAHPDGEVTLSVFEAGVPPRFRLVGADTKVSPAALRTIRPDGSVQNFTFHQGPLYWESNEEIPEPHEFRVEVSLRGAAGEQTVATEFSEHHHGDDDEDAHAREHAGQIKRRFAGREVSTGQIVLFGLTGGLMPCPAALAILLICLQLKRFTLGFSLVAGFSAGLALTLVTVGVVAAWGMKQVNKHAGAWSRLAGKAPYFSSALLIVLGCVFIARGAWHFI
jgi:nickel/cobalt exporter